MMVDIEPRALDSTKEIIIGLADIRAVNPIKITYCLQRDAWSIAISKEEDIEEDKWTEVAAITE